MTRHMGSGPLLFVKSRQGFVLALLCLACAAIAALAPFDLSPVPFRESDQALFGSVLVALPATMVSLCARRPSAELERGFPLIRATRLAWVLVCLGALTASGVLVAMARTSGAPLSVARNVLMLAALTLVFARWSQAGISWMPAALFAGACITYGTEGSMGEPLPWALLMSPTSDLGGWAVCAVLIVGAVATYALRDVATPRP